jgi:hypothetical protein
MTRDLDEAIDYVAARLTHVEDDAAMASRIVSALPERATWFGWLFHSWAPRLAMIAVVVAAAILLSQRRPMPIAPAVTQPPVASGSMGPVVGLVASIAPAPVRTKLLEPLEPLEPVEPVEPVELRSDHEFSLPAIEAVAALEMDSLLPAGLPEDAPLTVAPLAIAELPLTADFPQR